MDRLRRILVIILALSALTVLVTGVLVYSRVNTTGIKPPPPSPSIPPQQSSTNSIATERPTPTLSPTITPSVTPSPTPSPTDALPSTPAIFDFIVPDNFTHIQQAINKAIAGDTIFVRKGTYSESVRVDKPVWLVGENSQTTIIDAHSVAPSLLIIADNVNVTGVHVVNTPIPAQGNPWFSWEYIPSKQLPSIQINGSSGCNIYGNLFTNGSIGVDLADSTNNRVFENEFFANGEAVRISGGSHLVADNAILNRGCGGTGLVIASSHNMLINNTIADGTGGIWFQSGENNTLKGNIMRGNFISLLMGYTEPWLSFDNDVDSSNTVEGKPVCYWIGRTGETVPSDAGAVILVNSTDMIIKDLVLPQSTYGIVLVNTNASTVDNNQLASLSQAHLDQYHTPGVPLYILLLNSSGNQLEGNRGTLWLNYSSTNTLTGNTGVIRLSGSNSNLITKNTITKIGFMAIDWSGIVLSKSSNNTISENNIYGNSAGIGVDDYATFNRIINNTIHGNAQGGIVLGTMGPGAKNNLIFNNTITDNGNEGILDSAFGTQIIANNIVANRGNGLDMSADVNCTVTGNIIEGFFFGYGKSAYNCTVVANNITLNSRYGQYGVWFLSNMPGTFYHNNFGVPISFEHSNNTANVWDNGSEGNWWYFYAGTDSNGDGIGDTPFEIGPNNIDRYPLMKPFDISSAVPPVPPKI